MAPAFVMPVQYAGLKESSLLVLIKKIMKRMIILMLVSW